MDSFLQRKRKSAHQEEDEQAAEEEPTEVKLAMLSSLHPAIDQETILDVLLAHDGSVSQASASLRTPGKSKTGGGALGAQTSLRQFGLSRGGTGDHDELPAKKKLMSKKGATLHLYDPVDIEEHTPCTVIHNFLPAEAANELLREMLEEAKTFEKITFKLFENVVSSPHTSCFYLESYEEIEDQRTSYLYNGATLTDVRRLTRQLAKIKPRVQEGVNKEIERRIKTKYPGEKKLKHQSPKAWVPNAAFVNCYDGPKESVGWHSDHLTYLGPRAVIGSLSLGVAREFRVRRIVPKDSDKASSTDTPDAEGQLSIHLPHNSLLVMHAEMQEEWKHTIVPALSVDPHPIAGNARINITYRDYRANMHPRFTPRCACSIPCVLRVVQKKKDNHGKYFWMCHAGNVPGKNPCSFFQWAKFDDDGNPIWENNKTA